MFEFERVDIDTVSKEADFYEDRLIFHTKEWIELINNTHNVEPIFLKIFADGKHIGFFTGFLFSKFGIRIVGSPFRGWTTLYMGFNLKNNIEVKRAEIVNPLWAYLKKTYHCVYCEIIDRFITEDDAKQYGLEYTLQGSYGIDISGTEDELLARFGKHCRKQIRQFERNDATIEIAEIDERFAENYYKQLKMVFGYQNLVPSYDLKRVKELLNALKQRDMVLCLKVKNPEGDCIGSSISFGFNGRCYTWGSTSIREGKDYLQSEGLRWHMMQYWRSKNCFDYDMVGIREYKIKFNPYEIQVPRIILTSTKILIWGRNSAEKLYWVLNRIKRRMRGNK